MVSHCWPAISPQPRRNRPREHEPLRDRELTRPDPLRPAVVAYIVVLYVAALTLVIAGLPRLLQARWSDIIIFVTITTLAELWNVAIGPDSDMSLSFTTHFAGAVLFGPAFAAVVAAVSVLASDGVIRRQPLRHLMFNVANFALAAGVTGLVYDALRSTPIGQPLSLGGDAVALVAAAATYLVVNNTQVSLVINFSGGPFFHEWVASFRDIGVPYVSMAPLGALLAYAYQASPWTLLYFPMLVIVVYNGFKLFMTLRHETDHALVALADSIDKRDQYTYQHSLRVARFSQEIASHLGLSAREVDLLVSAARVHDLGKIATDNRVLFKQSSLTAEERRIINMHPAEGGELAGKFSMFRKGRLYIRHHHERWDGNGYPDGLAGADIPLGARIIAVADAYDAMTSDRPYRKALPHEIALAELERGAGKQFDAAVVEAFIAPQRLRAPAPLTTQAQESCSYS